MGNDLNFKNDNECKSVINQISNSEKQITSSSKCINYETKSFSDVYDKKEKIKSNVNTNTTIQRTKNVPDLTQKNQATIMSNILTNTNTGTKTQTNVDSTNTTNFLSLESLNSKINMCDISFTDYNKNKLSDLFDNKLVLFKSITIEWKEDANQVFILGSFNNWTSLELQKISENLFSINLVSYFYHRTCH